VSEIAEEQPAEAVEEPELKAIILAFGQL